MNNILDRFIKYVKIDTSAVEDGISIPSSPGQRELANVLREELINLGLKDARVDENSFLLASLPASKGYETSLAIGLLAHLDTAPDCSGKDVQPLVHKAYQGEILQLNDQVFIDPDQYPELLMYMGDDIITSDGSTLLGADDKSGIAIIMDVVEKLVKNPDLKHGPIKIAFTPDEEVAIGGASIFDVENFGADIGITVDGDGIGEFNYETFNAYSYTVHIKGNNIHPAEAKGKMINACSLAMEFDSLLPPLERAEYTSGHQGFIHLCELVAEVDKARLEYILRDFEKTGLEEKQASILASADFLNEKYGPATVTLEGLHEYSNPRDLVLQQGSIIETCKRAYRACGIEPIVRPIRGGTDGSTLTEKGLPCVNIFLGGHNYHSVREFVSLNAMEKSSQILLKTIELFA